MCECSSERAEEEVKQASRLKKNEAPQKRSAKSFFFIIVTALLFLFFFRSRFRVWGPKSSSQRLCCGKRDTLSVVTCGNCICLCFLPSWVSPLAQRAGGVVLQGWNNFLLRGWCTYVCSLLCRQLGLVSGQVESGCKQGMGIVGTGRAGGGWGRGHECGVGRNNMWRIGPCVKRVQSEQGFFPCAAVTV